MQAGSQEKGKGSEKKGTFVGKEKKVGLGKGSAGSQNPRWGETQAKVGKGES